MHFSFDLLSSMISSFPLDIRSLEVMKKVKNTHAVHTLQITPLTIRKR